jgi:hypothetical protein
MLKNIFVWLMIALNCASIYAMPEQIHLSLGGYKIVIIKYLNFIF